MESLVKAAITYRLIVTRRNGSEILLLPNGPRWTLPRVEIDPQQRCAEQLTAEVRRAWGLETYCLLVPGLPLSNAGEEPKCAAMESTRQNDRVPAGAFWISRRRAAASLEPAEAQLIREMLRELTAYATNEKPGPFARPGWLRDLCRWVEGQLAPFGLRLTGGIRQLNASPTFSLIRLETDREAVWFKATREPNSHELRVTVALARLFPGHIPSILGVHPSWNGWLSEEVAGVPLAEIAEFPAWERAAEGLAELQIASIGKTAELIEAQAKDLRIPRLAERIDPFLTRMKEVMAAQEKPAPAPLVESEIATLAEGLKESCRLLEAFGLPNTLGHVDVNPGNILVSADRCVFLDWAEACVGNPLLTFEYLCQHMARSGIAKPAAADHLASAYLRPWLSFHSPEDLRRALALAPLVAVFAYALANESWRSPELVRNPPLAGYFRSLTRRMYREAIQAAGRSELCLS